MSNSGLSDGTSENRGISTTTERNPVRVTKIAYGGYLNRTALIANYLRLVDHGQHGDCCADCLQIAEDIQEIAKE